MIKQYRKRPVVIEAVRYQPGPEGNCREVAEFMELEGFEVFDCVAEAGMGDDYDCSEEVWMIPTKEGVMEASPGDWIIKGIEGEYYPCKPSIFEATYEPA